MVTVASELQDLFWILKTKIVTLFETFLKTSVFTVVGFPVWRAAGAAVALGVSLTKEVKISKTLRMDVSEKIKFIRVL